MARPEEDEDLKAARGTLRADRKREIVSMEPLHKTVRTPKALLTKRAKVEYSRCLKHLVADGLAAEVDKSLLIAYCNEMANYDNLAKEIAEAEEVLSTTPTDAANITKYKALLAFIDSASRRRDTALKNAMKLGEMFGLTPSARGKIKAPKKRKDADPTAEAFNNLMKTA